MWVHPETISLAMDMLVQLWVCGVRVAMNWRHSDIVEAAGHSWLLLTSMYLYWIIESVWAPSYALWKGMWAYPDIVVKQGLLAFVLVIWWGQCGYEMMPWWYCWGCKHPLTASDIHIGFMKLFEHLPMLWLDMKVCYIVLWQINPRFRKFGVSTAMIWCRDDIFEAMTTTTTDCSSYTYIYMGSVKSVWALSYAVERHMVFTLLCYADKDGPDSWLGFR